MTAPAGDRVRAAVRISVPPAEAFRLFTEDIDAWWRRGPRYRALTGGDGVLHLEPRVGGRLFEDFAGRVVQTGTVLAWEPPGRLAFEWRSVTFVPGERTEVEVTFAGSADGGTLVTVTHQGWASLRPDHPVRHGDAVDAFVRRMGLWWGDLLTSLRERAAR